MAQRQRSTRYGLTDVLTGEILAPLGHAAPRTKRRTRRTKAPKFTNTQSVIANSLGMVTLLCSGLAMVVAITK